MENTSDITKRDYTYVPPYGDERLDVRLETMSYGHNGTLAIGMLSHVHSIPEIEEMTRMGMSWEAADEMEDYATLTVNLEGSDTLPLNVQFIDENNLPGIGDWLEKNGIAHPTGMMARSGWCLYPAYEFNLTQEKQSEILEQRMRINPGQTESVLQSMQRDKIMDIQDSLDKCMTLGELKETWLSMPEQIRDLVNFPEQIAIDGKETHTLKEWEQQRFTAPIPEGLPAYSYTEARCKFDECKEKIVQDGCRRETFPTPEGELTRFGDIELNQVTHYFPTEYSDPFLVEERDEDGRLTKEYIAIDTSYNDNIKSGPCIEHIDGRITAFSIYSTDITCDKYLRGARSTFSPKGSIIAVMEGNEGPSCGHIRHTDKYNKAVDCCRESLNKGLENIISKLENKSETQQKSKGPQR